MRHFDYLSSHIIYDTFPQRNEDTRIYSAVVFNMMKSGSGGKKDVRAADRERIYAAIKAFGLD